MQPPLHPVLFHSSSQDAHCTPVCLSLVSTTSRSFYFHLYSQYFVQFSFFLVLFSWNRVLSLLTFLCITCPTCHSMFRFLNIYLLCLIFLSFYLSALSLYFFIARLLLPHLFPAFSHFSWLVPPSHSFSSLATVGFRQLLRSPIG